ncbi:hypothetical protein G6011_04246 [Alternaria panax]|uniref:Uncharacterized protein n=1 Tax=Alternaria panax TaxID=48097 RepID=A0AAD4NSD8_9PLEO|nr:hypothetical protein G6011_04246 [Alternaria panax]
MEINYDKAHNSAYATILPTTEISVDLAPQIEPSATPAGSQSQQEHQFARSKPTKTKASSHIKLSTIYPRVLLLIACMHYLVTAVVVFNIGLKNISSFVHPRYDRAVDEFRAQSTTLYTEQILSGRLDKLLSTQLGSGFMETHENCLIRGLEKANYELLGLGIQYPSIRTQIMDWTVENCGRLQHTPQVVLRDPSPQQAALTYWADLSYRSRRKLEKAISFVQQQANWIWTRFLSTVPKTNASALTQYASSSAVISEQRYHQRSILNVPFGFALRCESSQPCRLFYSSSSVPSDKVSISPGALAKLERQSDELHLVYSVTQMLLLDTWKTVLVLDCVNIVSMVVAGVSVRQRCVGTDRGWSFKNCGKEQKHMIISIVKLLVVRLMSLSFLKYPGWLHFDELVISFGLSMLLCGVSMLLRFFLVPSSNSNTAFQMYRLIRELYLVAEAWEVPDEEDFDPKTLVRTDTQMEHGGSKAMDYPPADTELASFSFDHGQRYQSSKSHYRLDSPITSLLEDLETHKKAIEEELKTHQVMESNVESDLDNDIDTESDSEPDTENSGFVDLAGGVTPQLTDAGSGWSMVDA